MLLKGRQCFAYTPDRCGSSACRTRCLTRNNNEKDAQDEKCVDCPTLRRDWMFRRRAANRRRSNATKRIRGELSRGLLNSDWPGAVEGNSRQKPVGRIAVAELFGLFGAHQEILRKGRLCPGVDPRRKTHATGDAAHWASGAGRR